MPTQFLQVCAGPAEEDAAVPVIVARSYIHPRRLGIRLLVELGDPTDPAAERLTCAHIAVPRVGTRRTDAESDQVARDGAIHRRLHTGAKRIGQFNVVIRRHDQQHGILAVSPSVTRSQSHRRSSAARHALQHESAAVLGDLATVFGDDEPMLFVADDVRGHCIETGHAQQRLLQHGAVAGEGKKVLGVAAAREGPPGAFPRRPPTLLEEWMSNASLHFSSDQRPARVSPVCTLLLSFYRVAFGRWERWQAERGGPGRGHHCAFYTSIEPTSPIAAEASKKLFGKSVSSPRRAGSRIGCWP